MSNAIWCEGKRGICQGEMYCTKCEHADWNGSVELSESLLAYIRQLEEQVGKDKDVPHKKRICPTTGLECCECKPGGPCAKEG